MSKQSEVRELGAATAWMRDVAIVGGVTSFLATAMFASRYGWLFPMAAGLGGIVTGVALGAVMHRLLSGRLKRWPISILLLIGPVIGAGWGAAVALLASPALDMRGLWAFAAMVGGFSGAVQLGWFWFPYTLLRLRGAGAWIVVALASLLGPLLGSGGVLAILGLGAIIGGRASLGSVLGF